MYRLLQPLFRLIGLFAALLPIHMIAATPYEIYIDSAEYYASKEKFNEAAEFYRKALRASPASPLNSKIFTNLGVCLAETDHLQEALEALDIALIKESKPKNVLNVRARVLIKANRPEEALTDLNRSLELDSIQELPLTLRGNLLLDLHQPEKAVKDFSSLYRHFPANPQGYHGLGRSLIELGDPDEGIRMLMKASEIVSEAFYRHDVIVALIEAGRLSDARESIFTAMSDNPRDSELFLLRGIVNLRSGRTEDALLDKRLALEYGADPGRAENIIPSPGKHKDSQKKKGK